MNFSRLTFICSQKLITALLSCLDAFTAWNIIFKLCCNVVRTGCSHILIWMVLHKFLPAYLPSQMCGYTIYTAKLSVVTWFQFYVPHKICCLFLLYVIIICMHYIHKHSKILWSFCVAYYYTLWGESLQVWYRYTVFVAFI